MDGNKDEALRCIAIAEEAIASGNKQRALRFIRFAQRLNRDSSVDDLLAACERLGSVSGRNFDDGKRSSTSRPGTAKSGEGSVGDRGYTVEHSQLVRQIMRTKDHYMILGVEKTCSVDDIRKAYRKLSLKVHPDKNKAPGAEEAFKKVCASFKCLSDSESRRKYDHVGLVRGFEYTERSNVRPRRTRRNFNGYYDNDVDLNEMFGRHFNQNDQYRAYNAYRNRERERENENTDEFHGRGPRCFILLQILPFLLIFLLAYAPFSEPEYSLHKNYSYQIPKTTEKQGVEYFVKSSAFDESFPLGSTARRKIENSVVADYKNLLWRHCHIEMQRRHWNKVLPTPNCNKLHNLGLA
ncbi:Chaperone protein dnaJ 49 [Linum grandiflorum]